MRFRCYPKTTLIMLCLYCLLSAIPAIAEQEKAAPLESTLASLTSRYEIPGVSAAIIYSDGTFETSAAGWADVEQELPMTTQTKMLAASIGKTITAASILLLVREGKLNLDDKASLYLQTLPWYQELPNINQITIRQLLQHTAGFPDHVYFPEFHQSITNCVKQKNCESVTPRDAIALLRNSKPLFSPGADWSYSDTGYLVLGVIIESIINESYYTWVKRSILAPVGLKSTIPANSRALPFLAVGYTSEDNNFGLTTRTADKNGKLLWDPSVEWTGGGFAMTAFDLALWGELLYSGSFLKKHELTALLDGVQVSADSKYGLGTVIYEDKRFGEVYGHRGWVPGYISSLRYYKQYGFTVAFQINTDRVKQDEKTDVVAALEDSLANFAYMKNSPSAP